MAMVAEEERRMISRRTKDALQAAKRRGVKLGGDRGVKPTARARKLAMEAIKARAAAKAADIGPIIAELQAAGVTSRTGIAAALNEQAIPTARGDGVWTATQVSRVLARL
jgi:DNA invertase Pin-like site-specific DNA recombinase